MALAAASGLSKSKKAMPLGFLVAESTGICRVSHKRSTYIRLDNHTELGKSLVEIAQGGSLRYVLDKDRRRCVVVSVAIRRDADG